MEGTTRHPPARLPHWIPGRKMAIVKVAMIGTGVWLIAKKLAQ